MTELRQPLTVNEGILSHLLNERGVDELISEYEETADPVRREELHRFLAACKPKEPNNNGLEWDVHIADLDTLRREERISLEIPSSRQIVQVPGQDVPDMSLFLIDLHDSIIFSDQTVVARHGLFIAEEIRHMSRRWLAHGDFHKSTALSQLVNIHPAHRTARIELTSAPLKLPDTGVYFLFHGLIGTTSFGHFLFDLLGQLIVFDQLRMTYGSELIPVITSNHWFTFKWPGMTWLFEQLVGRETDVVHLEGHCRAAVRRAYTTSRVVVSDDGVSFAALRYLRRRIADCVERSPGTTSPERIYVSRKDAGYREVGNIDHVERLFESFGFKTVLVENLTPQQAYDAFEGAKVIAGMHGSGLMYHFYARNSVTLIEIAESSIDWRILLSTAAILGHTPIRIGNVGNDADIKELTMALQNL